jgi:hypothetical protein
MSHARHLFIPCLFLAAGCGDQEQIAPTPVCAATQPASGWPAEPGILHIDAPLPSLPFTPTPHRAAPPILPAHPVVLRKPKIVTVIAAGDPLADQLFAFSDAVRTSAWWGAVGAEFQVGTPSASVHVVGPALTGTVRSHDIAAYAARAVEAAGAKAASDGQTIFLVYLPEGVEYVNGSGARNCGCSLLLGAHFRRDPHADDAIAFVQRCSPHDIESLTVTASHELLESATNPTIADGYVVSPGKEPWQGTVWSAVQPGPNELADLCGGTRVHEGDWEYQRSFSNIAALKGDDPCAPALAEPYYNVTVDQEWYPIASGGKVTVEVRGWATAPREDWFVYTRVASPTQVGFTAEIHSDESASADGTPFYGINNGKTATLTVTAPEAPVGTYAVVRLTSRPSSPGSDVLHFWPVGFVIQ